MPSRPIWRGHLRLALVSCPVAMFNARSARETIHFHLINPKTGNRIKMVTKDSETGEELQRVTLVKGYEYAKNHYITLTDEDFDTVKVESSAIMSVEKFVDAESIDPIYYDDSYYLAPDAKAGEDVYAVLREAITKTGKVALTRVVISQRERTVALRPMGAGLMAHTLYEERDLNKADSYFDEAARLKVEPEMVDLAVQLINRQTATYDPADLEDRYETRLRAMIDAKAAGLPLVADEVPDRGNVIDLVAALRKSVAEAEKTEKAEGAAKAEKRAPKMPLRKSTVQPIAKTPRKLGAGRADSTIPAAPVTPSSKTSGRPTRR
jgi:DNA end-binding protein Ku